MKRRLSFVAVAFLFSLILSIPNNVFATATMNGCTVTAAGTNSSGVSWITVTYNSTSYNMIVSTAAPNANFFMANALTAISAQKNVNLVVTEIKNWGVLQSLTVVQ